MKTRLSSHNLLSLGRIVAMAWAAVRAYSIRGIFVVSAVALGIAVLTMIVMAVDGANAKVDELTQAFGPDAAFVIGGDIFARPVGQRVLTLTWDDVRRIREALPGVKIVAPGRRAANVQLRYAGKVFEVADVTGSTSDYSLIWDWPLLEGQDLSEADIDSSARVCLLGTEPVKHLFGDANPIGKSILVNDSSYRVIGVLASRGASGGGQNLDDRIVIPITTLAQRFNMDRQYFPLLRVKFFDATNMDANAKNLESLLQNQHGISDGKNDFSILTANDIQRFINMFKSGLVLFLGITAVSAMVVSGFVLANLLYLSVAERTIEIGLKKALGASNNDILLQFMAEALILTLIGAVFGLLLGMLGVRFLEQSLVELEFSWRTFSTAVIAAILVGGIFGVKPARQASLLDPITALKGGE